MRQVSEGNRYGKGRQVGVVDERSEIAGSFMGIPQNHVGMRTDVLDGCPKVQGMMLLMRSMAPSVVAVDEIGGGEDMRALLQVLQCGSSVVATMHGDSMEDVEERIFDRYLFLEKRKGVCGIREIYDKSGNRIYPAKAERLCCG